jgi:anti-sigma-K factor RskA
MSIERPTADIHTLTGAYVLHALSGDERAEFERHLTECVSCAQEVAELDETAARLGAAIQVLPPPSLKSRVLAEVAQTRQLPPLGPPAAAPGQVVQLRPRRWVTWTALTAAAASVLFAVVVGIGAMRTNDQLNDELTALRATNSQLNELLGAPDASVSSAAASTGGTGIFVVSREQDRAMFLADGFAALGDTQDYQLWLFQDPTSAPRSGGVLDSADESLLAQNLADIQSVAISIEPSGGSPQPTSDPIMILDLST